MNSFVYVIYIRTTPEKLWTALREPEFTRQYWAGSVHDSEWKKESYWQLTAPDGRVTDSGKVLEIDPPRRLVLSWRNEFISEMRAEGYSRCTFALERRGELTKLCVEHAIDKEGSKFIAAVSSGWPMILSSLKSLIETGESFDETRHWPKEL